MLGHLARPKVRTKSLPETAAVPSIHQDQVRLFQMRELKPLGSVKQEPGDVKMLIFKRLQSGAQSSLGTVGRMVDVPAQNDPYLAHCLLEKLECICRRVCGKASRKRPSTTGSRATKTITIMCSYLLTGLAYVARPNRQVASQSPHAAWELAFHAMNPRELDVWILTLQQAAPPQPRTA